MILQASSLAETRRLYDLEFNSGDTSNHYCSNELIGMHFLCFLYLRCLFRPAFTLFFFSFFTSFLVSSIFIIFCFIDFE